MFNKIPYKYHGRVLVVMNYCTIICPYPIHVWNRTSKLIKFYGQLIIKDMLIYNIHVGYYFLINLEVLLYQINLSFSLWSSLSLFQGLIFFVEVGYKYIDRSQHDYSINGLWIFLNLLSFFHMKEFWIKSFVTCY